MGLKTKHSKTVDSMTLDQRGCSHCERLLPPVSMMRSKLMFVLRTVCSARTGTHRFKSSLPTFSSTDCTSILRSQSSFPHAMACPAASCVRGAENIFQFLWFHYILCCSSTFLRGVACKDPECLLIGSLAAPNTSLLKIREFASQDGNQDSRKSAWKVLGTLSPSLNKFLQSITVLIGYCWVWVFWEHWYNWLYLQT